MPYIKILAIYSFNLFAYFKINTFLRLVMEMWIYIFTFMIFPFEEYLFLIIISTLLAILFKLINNFIKKSKDKSVRLVPYVSFAFCFKAFDLFKEHI